MLPTWHPSTSPGDWELLSTQWLDIKKAANSGDAGVVEVVARCKVKGKAERMHETSHFVQMRDALGERWLSIDGAQHQA